MAVSITKYPGGLEYPTAWASNVQGLTPQGTYVVSFEDALKKYPGLQYSKEFQEAQTGNKLYGAPTSSQGFEDLVAQAKKEWDSQPSGTPQSYASYKNYQGVVKAYSDWAVANASFNQPAAEKQSDSSSISSSQSDNINTVSDTGSAVSPKTLEEPVVTPKEITPEKTIEAFEQKLLDQAKGEAVNWPSSSSSEALIASEPSSSSSASSDPTKPLGPSTPVKYDPVMKQYAPYVDPGKVLLEILKKAEAGPKGEELAQQFGPKGETLVAEVYYGKGFPKTPSWIKTLEADYQKNIKKPINPGPIQNSGKGALDTWEGPGGWGASAPGANPEAAIAKASSAAEEQKAQGVFQSEYDPQKAQLAASASKAYKVGSSTEDPFKTGVFG